MSPGHDRGRPRHESGPSVVSTPTGGASLTLDENGGITSEAAALIAAGRAVGPIPNYGSDDFAALPSDDPRRLAALAGAAEAWREHCLRATISADLAAELTCLEDSLRARVREASWDVGASPAWSRLSTYRARPVRREAA